MAAVSAVAMVAFGSSAILQDGASADAGELYIQYAVPIGLSGFADPATEKPLLSDFTPEAPAAGISNLSASSSTMIPSAGVQASSSFKGGRGGCSIQCITGGKAYAHGVDAELRVQTDTFAYISVWVWGEQAQGMSRTSQSMVKGFGALFRDLEPGTTYSVLVEAVDGKGYRSYASGSFTTLVRKLTVSFDSAELIALPYGDNALTAKLWVEGQWRNELHKGPYAPTTTPRDDDFKQLFFGDLSLTVKDVDRRLNIALELTQHKTLWYDNRWNSCEVNPLYEAPPSTGTTIDADCGHVATYAFATLVDGMNDLDAGLGVSSWRETRHVVQLEVPINGGPTPDYGKPLDFNVPNVELLVEYVTK